jgi:medium-chain acyl-[acyl-carrier-protein] hydrolase
MTSGGANPWVKLPSLSQHARLLLFCFPYAGGSARIFDGWQNAFPKTIAVCPIQYPGRGNRLREKANERIEPLVEKIAESLMLLLDRPFAFFGHSMGAMISFELARYLRRKISLLPVHLFLSGCRALQFPDREAATYDLAEPDFIKELRRLNGTPAEVLEDPELMQLVLPTLRADFALVQTYDYVSEPPLPCAMSIYCGSEDQILSREDLEGWREQTTGVFSLRMFQGDHFYLHTASEHLLRTLNQELRQHVDYGTHCSAAIAVN